MPRNRTSASFLRNKQKSKLSVRRAQLITTYGIGSLIPSDSESFIVMGQDFWKMPDWDDSNVFFEPALQKILKVAEFRYPPDGEHNRVPIMRFPGIVQCPSCGALGRFWELAKKNKSKDYINQCKRCSATKQVSLVPSRFVAVCPYGHMEDFPYFHWVHKGIEAADDVRHNLSIKNDPDSESLAGMTIECSCGAERSMEGALGQYALDTPCHGEMPWLETTDAKECDQKLKGLQRGSTSVWSALTRSAIAIDRDLTELEEAIINSQYHLGSRDITKRNKRIERLADSFNVSEDEILELAEKHLSDDIDIDALEAALREDEYQAFLTEHEEIDGTESFVCGPQRLSGENALDGRLAVGSMVSRMREVRVLCGFTRGGGPNDKKDWDKNRGILSTEPKPWLPAIEVFGEGIFIGLDDKAVQEWEVQDFAKGRMEALIRNSDASVDPREFEPRRLLLHTFAHVMVNQLALNTGYPASSIRERVYADDGQAGVFLYTATADSAGSLGGLCAQADPDRLQESVLSALDTARWCSADPVCIETIPVGGGHANLAACHYCGLLPEVSCERKNSGLDRACLVGTPDFPQGGYFSGLWQ